MQQQWQLAVHSNCPVISEASQKIHTKELISMLQPVIWNCDKIFKSTKKMWSGTATIFKELSGGRPSVGFQLTAASSCSSELNGRVLDAFWAWLLDCRYFITQLFNIINAWNVCKQPAKLREQQKFHTAGQSNNLLALLCYLLYATIRKMSPNSRWPLFAEG